MTFIEKWLRSDIKNINAYHVPESKNLLKLDAMESPFGVPSDLKEEFLEYIDKAEVNRYPDAASTQLKDTLRDLMDICLLYTSPSPRDGLLSRMPSSA